jgi:hypothetical protein
MLEMLPNTTLILGLVLILFWTLGDLILVSARFRLTRTHHSVFFVCLMGLISYAVAGNFGPLGRNLGLLTFWLLIAIVIANRKKYYG